MDTPPPPVPIALTCPHCFHSNPQGALLCECCYAALDALLTCTNCGTLVPSYAAFCSQCSCPLPLSPSPAASGSP